MFGNTVENSHKDQAVADKSRVFCNAEIFKTQENEEALTSDVSDVEAVIAEREEAVQSLQCTSADQCASGCVNQND